jgi:hypothetical protein
LVCIAFEHEPLSARRAFLAVSHGTSCWRLSSWLSGSGLDGIGKLLRSLQGTDAIYFRSFRETIVIITAP